MTNFVNQGTHNTQEEPIEKVIPCRLVKNAQMQGARNPESGVATSKERPLATPASWWAGYKAYLNVRRNDEGWGERRRCLPAGRQGGFSTAWEYSTPQLKDTETLGQKGKKCMPASGEIVWLPREASHTGVMGTRAIPLTWEGKILILSVHNHLFSLYYGQGARRWLIIDH